MHGMQLNIFGQFIYFIYYPKAWEGISKIKANNTFVMDIYEQVCA